MDTTSVVALAVAGAAILTGIGFAVRNRTHARAVDAAIARIGGSRPRRRRHRSAALTAAIDHLERSTVQAQRERSRLAGAVQAAPVGILITDDNGVVLAANPAAARFLGSSVGEAVAQVRVREAIERAVLTRTAGEVEVELYSPSRAVLDVSAVPLDFGVESVGAVAFIDDATESRRVAAMRRDFVANVSHELKTPLAALAALAEALAGSVPAEGPAAGLAERVRHEADRLAKLIGDILDLSQAEALTAHDEPVSLAAVIDAVAKEMVPIADAAGVRLVVEATPSRARVTGDARQLRSMLTNLVENGIKYSIADPDRPAPAVTVTTAIAGDRVAVAVRDEGIGIAENHQDRIFERFYRVDRARSRETGGTGLGLSIARHIARNHHGDITVSSREGEGAVFTVDLPLWSTA